MYLLQSLPPVRKRLTALDSGRFLKLTAEEP